MNYYNPYFYAFPSTAYSAAPKTGLFSRLFGGKLTLSSIINSTQKTLGFINQAIPVVKQATPIVRNAKTMFKVMNEFKKSDRPKQNYNLTNSKKKTNSVNNNNNNNNNSDSNVETDIKTVDQGPTFFI